MARARIADDVGLAAVDAWLDAQDHGTDAPRRTVATAVRYTLQALADRVPGHSVEVRVPPWGAVQCIPGPGHTRGTPPNVVECAPETWLRLATGLTDWADALAAGRIDASGVRADVSIALPVLRRPRSGD